MQNIFIGKKQLLACVLLLFAAISVLLYFNLKQSQTVATNIQEPYYQGTAKNAVSLIINVDWGEEYLPAMLKLMQDRNIKVSFFLTGRWTEKNPQLAAEIMLAGHEIGNHGYSHKSPNNSSLEENMKEISETEKAIYNNTLVKTILYGPPSGEREDHVLQAAAMLNYQVVLWSLDTIDWQKPSADVICQRILPRLHDGAIILAHPTASTLEALPRLFDGIAEQGYKIISVSDNIGCFDNE